tara:strand:+ start:381 stop:677 length:297 start_codon:yes stop_codon:yes gene_type:complete
MRIEAQEGHGTFGAIITLSTQELIILAELKAQLEHAADNREEFALADTLLPKTVTFLGKVVGEVQSMAQVHNELFDIEEDSSDAAVESTTYDQHEPAH